MFSMGILWTLQKGSCFILTHRMTGIIQTSENNYSVYSWNKSIYIKNPDLLPIPTVEIVDMYGRNNLPGKIAGCQFE